MGSSWNIEPLRAHVRGLGEQAEYLSAVIDSLDKYAQIFVYHMANARDAMNEVIVPDDPHGIENSKFLFGMSDRQNDYYKGMLKTHAHALGCIHASRSIFDIFAQLVNALVLPKPLSIDDCTLHKAVKKMDSGPLKDSLTALAASEAFQYVGAYSNTSKHRMLIPVMFSVSFEDNTATIWMRGFKSGNVEYPKKTLKDVLLGSIEVKNAIVACGRALCAQIGVAHSDDEPDEA